MPSDALVGKNWHTPDRKWHSVLGYLGASMCIYADPCHSMPIGTNPWRWRGGSGSRPLAVGSAGAVFTPSRDDGNRSAKGKPAEHPRISRGA